MWDWAHFNAEGWCNHTKKSSRLVGLLVLAAAALAVHTVVPFWQQPKWLRLGAVAEELCSRMKQQE